jgi:hypothetical protein
VADGEIRRQPQASRPSCAMITKTFFMAKTFRAQSTNYLRYEKSIRDHGGE